MSVWRSPKPVIAQVHGWCVGGGSDLALCADLVIASEDARHRDALLAHVGRLPERACGSTASGSREAKEHALTGRPLSGSEAAEVELINEAVPFAELEAEVRVAGVRRSPRIPSSQLAAMKLVVNQAYENMGLAVTQTLGPILDGLMRNTPDALEFIELAERDGVRAAVAERDGPFGDYSPGAPGRQPGPGQRHRALTAMGRGCARGAEIVGRPGRCPEDAGEPVVFRGYVDRLGARSVATVSAIATSGLHLPR